MAETLKIQIERSADQKSITVTNQTTGAIDTLTSIVLYVYITTTSSPEYTYEFSAEELTEYKSNGSVTITFLDLSGNTYLTDNWYLGLMDGNDGDYLSNYDGFGTYYYTKNKLYTEGVNGLNTPERDLPTMQALHFNMIALKGLEELDTSNNVSRDVKFKKRLSALTKMLNR